MDNLEKEQIVQSYKMKIVEIFTISDEWAIVLAEDLFNILVSLGATQGGGAEKEDEETIRVIVGSWIANKYLKPKGSN